MSMPAEREMFGASIISSMANAFQQQVWIFVPASNFGESYVFMF